MLRPATPLSILLFISFVLLLISVISTPIVKGIPIGRYEGVNFGVFGWCKDSGECSGVRVGWNTDEALPNQASDDVGINLPSGSRHILSSLLIVHPIAALCNLIVLGLAVAAHLHSPSHSARYLLALLILLLPTLLVTLLAFLVDILIFVPHLQWGGWIVLASTILITASGVVTCAMRRTLVSRKARKKRIAENAEMSGANFYARQAEESKMVPSTSTESRTQMMNDSPAAENLPTFNTYPSTRSQERPMHAPSPAEPVSATSPIDSGRYYGHGGQRSRSNSRPRQEDFGAPLGATRSYDDRPPVPAMPPTPNRSGYGAARGGYSTRGSFSGRSVPPSPYRGRGGYPPRGRGGYPAGPNGPGMPGVMVPTGMNRRPPPGYGPQSPTGMDGGYGPPSGPDGNYSRPGDPGFEPPSPSNYGSEAPAGYSGSAYGSRAQSPAARRQSPYGSRAQSPSRGLPPQDIPPAMPPVPDHYGPEVPVAYSGVPYGSRAQSPAARRQSPYGSRAQSPARGILPQDMPPAMPPVPDRYGPAVQQPAVMGMDPGSRNMAEMESSQAQVMHQVSGGQDYVPPRAEWHSRQSSSTSQNRRRVNSGGSDYMEDVDPKFAQQSAPPMPSITTSAPPPEVFQQHDRQHVPSILLAGHHPNPNDPSPESSNSQVNNPNVISHIPREHSYENLHSGTRSPVESEISNFTSVSQRPMNPNWQPGHPDGFNSFGPGNNRALQERQRQRQQDILFSGNPDFEIPGMGPPRTGNIRGGYRGLGRGGGGYSGLRGPMRPPPPSVLESMAPDGRYPQPMPPSSGMGGAGTLREV